MAGVSVGGRGLHLVLRSFGRNACIVHIGGSTKNIMDWGRSFYFAAYLKVNYTTT